MIAFNAGLASLRAEPDVVVKLDADVSLDPSYFERILIAFERDARVGMASGLRYDQSRDGSWRVDPSPRGNVAAQCRAYRWNCLQDVLPLVERLGWDRVDEVKAELCGWQLVVIEEVGLRHHRWLGARDGSRSRVWMNQGRTSYYLGYRPTYLALRTLWQLRREPAAIAMVFGWAHERLRGGDNTTKLTCLRRSHCTSA